jgi:hypothetical protein
MRKNELRETFITSFDFLWNSYGFVIKKDKKEDWGYTLEAVNKVAGIKVVYEYREAFVNVILYKLINGEIIENTNKAILNNEKINGFSIDYIIKLLNPDDLEKPYYPKESEVDEKNDLKFYVLKVAEKVKKYGTEILMGDFTLFDKLDTMVKEYYKDYYNNRK